ncbi:UNVERIFIED_ORG: hypothetical protein J2X79_001967 [Arthrobacter globiformis]|nr:hypothetical protein [Arthrobacter globiformis]
MKALRTKTASRLLSILPGDGTPRTNAELREQLDVSNDEYWSARNELLGEGLVAKLRGRGGRTALVVEDDQAADVESPPLLRRLVGAAFGLSAVFLVSSAIYAVTSTSVENWLWNTLALLFGAVTVAAVGVSLLIFKVQTESERVEADGQARVLSRLEALARQAATSSSDSRDILRAMQPAVDATSDSEAADNGDDRPGWDAVAEVDDMEQLPEGSVFVLENGTYYRPPAIPIAVLSDLVQWWKDEGETGRWTLSRLVGGYRPFNRSGNHTGVPWVLTFDNGEAGYRSFRLAYSGRRKGPAVSELVEGAGWHELSLKDGVA